MLFGSCFMTQKITVRTGVKKPAVTFFSPFTD